MTIVTYKVESLVCPKCKHRLVFGYRSFGPSQVQCGYCNELLSTGLVGWDDLDKKEKDLTMVREILNPSWMGVRESRGYVLHLVFMYPFISVMIMMPIMFVVIGLLSVGYDNMIGWTLGLIGLLLFFIGPMVAFLAEPALNVRRLKRMINESRKYKLDSKPPVWKKIV